MKTFAVFAVAVVMAGSAFASGATLSGPTALYVGETGTYTLDVVLTGGMSDTFMLVADDDSLVSIAPADAQELGASGQLTFAVKALAEGEATLSVEDDEGLGEHVDPIVLTISEKEPVPYVVRGWDGSAGTESDAVCTNFTVYNGQTMLTSGWYVVAGNVTNDSHIVVDGDVHLILCDGAVLTALRGITVKLGKTLTIYGQSGDTGTLFAGTDGTTKESGSYNTTGIAFTAGIGGSSGAGGKVIIHGGTIVAIAGNGGAGIGGGHDGDGGDVTIYGGTVTACGAGGAAIGRGKKNGGNDGDLTLGEMKVTEPAGIVATGRVDTCRMRNTTVRLEPCRMHEFGEDGKCKWCKAAFRPVPYVERGWDGSAVTEREGACTNFAYLAGQERLESGWYVVADNVTNNNRLSVVGDVRVILCDRMTLTVPYGITVEGTNNSLTVYGQSGGSGRLFAGTDGTTEGDGRYTTTCTDYCAGIGGGRESEYGAITVHGGTVVAAGDEAGIGGGYESYRGGAVTVYGGTVAALGGYNGAGIGGGWKANGGRVTVYGGTVAATGGYKAAGIGGGLAANDGFAGWGGDVTIHGGTVTATGGADAAAIGKGYNSGGGDGKLDIAGMRVTDPAGTLATNRVGACRTVGESVTLEVCEPHEYEDGVCKWCGTGEPWQVAFVWHGGSFETNYPAGTAAADVAVPDDPETYTENGTNYAFTGWSPAAVADVTTNATYTARYGIVPEVEVVSCVVTADGDDDEMTLVLAGPDDCDGVADVAIHEWDTTGAEPVPGEVVWSTNGVALAGGAAELTVSVDTGVVLPGQLVVARYLPNEKYAGATASNRVMGTSSITIDAASNYTVTNDIVLGLTAVNSTGAIAVTLYVPDGNGGLTKYDWDCTVVSNTATLGFLPVGEYVVKAVLAGDVHYLGSMDTKSFRVDKIEPGLGAEAAEATEGEPVTVTATLGHDDCTGTVTVAVDGDEYDGAVIEGMAVVSFPGLAAGDYEATVTYSGDEKYLEASTNFTFNVAVARPCEEVDGVIWYYKPVGTNAMVTGIEEEHATGDLTMPDTLGGLTVTSVGSEAFDHLTNITGMALASGVKDIWNDAFCGCTGLTNVTMGAAVETIDRDAFRGCSGLTDATIPNGVAVVGATAFSLAGLTNVTFGTGLTAIGEGGFSYCTNLANVKLPDGAASIGKEAFYGNRSLTNVWLGTGIESVGENAFDSCTNLATMWVPVERKDTGLLDAAGVREGCEIHYYGTQWATFDGNGGRPETATNGYTIGTEYGWLPGATRALYTFDGWWATNDQGWARVETTDDVTESFKRTLVAWWEAGVTTNGARWLCATNEDGSGVTVTGVVPAEGALAMPDKLDGYAVTAVGTNAFQNCSNLTGMALADGVTNIGAWAFSECVGLTNVTIPNGVASIGIFAFYENRSLTNVWLGTGIESVGENAFESCTNLATMWVPVGQKNTGLLNAAGVREGCEIRYYGTQVVTFEANGGTCAVKTNGYVIGEAYGELPEAARTGYDFLGWFDEAGGGVEVTGADAVTEEAARTLTARWRVGGGYYTVAYNRNGGTGTMATQVIPRGTKAWLRYNAFRRADHTFMGWAETWNGAVVHADHAAVTDRAPAGGSITFYARWAKTKYTVAFDANGGTGSMAKQGMTYGTAAALRKNAFKKSGWDFAGWARWPNGPVAFVDEASVKNLRTDGGTTTLYAKWAKPAYTVVYKANGGTGTMAAQTIQRGAKAWLRYNAFRRAGFTFIGWAETWNGAVVRADHAAVTDLAPAGGSVTFYARWAKSRYSVAFDANGGAGSMAAQGMAYGTAAALRMNAFKKSGWAFAGWARWPNGPVAFADGASVKNLRTDGNTTTLYAKWAKPTYRVAFDANGGKVSKRRKEGVQTFEYGKGKRLRDNPYIRSGHFFIGWATTRDGAVAYGNKEWVKNLRTDGGTTTLYAQWARKTYTVAFDANGGTGRMADQLYIYGHAAHLSSNRFARAGFAFGGWAKSPNGPVAYADWEVVDKLRTDGGTTTLYAQWRARGADAAAAGTRTVNSAKGKGKNGEKAVVTTSDGSDGSTVADGDETTGWSPSGTAAGTWAWVVLSFEKAREVSHVDVAWDGEPEGVRVLVSEDGETWEEAGGEPVAARYVWVAWEAGAEGAAAVREVRCRGAGQ